MIPELPLLDGNSTLVDRISANLLALVCELLSRAVESVPPGHVLPRDHFSETVAPALVSTIGAVVSALNEGRYLSRGEVAREIAPIIERYAEDRIPMHIVLAALHSGMADMWLVARQCGGEGDVAELGAFGSLIHDVLSKSVLAICDVYGAFDESLDFAQRESSRKLCNALLRGEPTDVLAAQSGINPSTQYRVITVHVVGAQTEVSHADGLRSRERLRVFRRHIEAVADVAILTTFDGVSGACLVPIGGDPVRSAQIIQGLFDEIADDVDGLYAAASSPVDLPGIPAAAMECTEIVDLAQHLNRPPGLYEAADLALEFQLSRPGPARDHLVRLLEPLLVQPHLLEALRVHLKHGGDRKSAAAEMYVHPNTLTYRLTRVADLTGVSPSSPDGARLLAAALVVHRVSSASMPLPG